jgi:hypothetical protein
VSAKVGFVVRALWPSSCGSRDKMNRDERVAEPDEERTRNFIPDL